MEGKEGGLSSSFSIGILVQFILLCSRDQYGSNTHRAWSQCETEEKATTLEKEEWKVCALYNVSSAEPLTMEHLNIQKTSPTLCWLLFPQMGLVLVPPHGKNQV